MLDFIGKAAAGTESFLAKMKSSLRSELDDAASRAGERVGAAIAKIAIWIVAALLFGVALAFATASAYQALLTEVSSAVAALIVAGAYAVLAVLCVALTAAVGRPKKPAAPPLEAPAAAGASAPSEPPSQPAGGGTDAASGTQPLDLTHVATLLGAVGRPQEQAALLVASEIAKSLSPPQLLAAGLAAGFVLGRKIELPGRRTRDPA